MNEVILKEWQNFGMDFEHYRSFDKDGNIDQGSERHPLNEEIEEDGMTQYRKAGF